MDPEDALQEALQAFAELEARVRKVRANWTDLPPFLRCARAAAAEPWPLLFFKRRL